MQRSAERELPELKGEAEAVRQAVKERINR